MVTPSADNLWILKLFGKRSMRAKTGDAQKNKASINIEVRKQTYRIPALAGVWVFEPFIAQSVTIKSPKPVGQRRGRSQATLIVRLVLGSKSPSPLGRFRSAAAVPRGLDGNLCRERSWPASGPGSGRKGVPKCAGPHLLPV